MANGESSADDFDDDFAVEPLGDAEIRQVEEDLADLIEFEATFQREGYRGVAVWCHDCAEEHFYPWDMLRENLTMLLETGETPVHEPAFAPEPARYIPWDYARGYVDALRDTGANDRSSIDACGRCGLDLSDELRTSNFCPRCGTALSAQRLAKALREAGIPDRSASLIMRAAGFAWLSDAGN